MGETGGRNGNGIAVFWKWVSATLASFMVMGALLLIPAYIALLHTPSEDKVDQMRERQEIILQRIATVEERLNSSAADRAALHQELANIDDKLDELLQRR